MEARNGSVEMQAGGRGVNANAFVGVCVDQSNFLCRIDRGEEIDVETSHDAAFLVECEFGEAPIDVDAPCLANALDFGECPAGNHFADDSFALRLDIL